MSRPSDEPALPKTIGRYAVEKQLGAGAMGRVLLAHDPVLGRDVAIKVLRRDLQIPADVREGLIVRMRHEARAAARVSHPNLVTLHDMGEDDDVGLYLVFEYVEGPTLKERLREGRLPPEEAAQLARELGSALTFAHEAGILHRDVKPDNVMLAVTGSKMTDFGIARIPDSTLTQTGGLLGTPAYSAPETFLSRTNAFSAASDQFSLAASLYEAVFGERAFPGDDAVAVAAKIATDSPERLAVLAELAPAVDDVFARALAKTAAGRFPSCKAFGDALSDALGVVVAASAPVAMKAGVGEAHAAPRRLDLPRERKTGQVLLGASVVVVTAALLLRTALRSAAVDDPDPPLATSAAAAASVAPARLVVHSATPVRPKPHVEGDVHVDRDLDAGAAPTHDRSDLDASAPPDPSKSKQDAGP